jgi:hypothetical protein
MKSNRRSSNIVDARKRRAKDVYEKSQTTPRGIISAGMGNLGQMIGPSQAQKKNAKALGLSGSLAGLQNKANKVEAVRRSRISVSTDTEITKSAKDVSSLLKYASSRARKRK